MATTTAAPFEKLHVLLYIIYKVLVTDIAIFMSAFVWIFFAAYTGLYVLYPRAGLNELPQVEEFNNWQTPIWKLINVAVIGESIELHMVSEAYAFMSNSQLFALNGWPLASIK